MKNQLSYLWGLVLLTTIASTSVFARNQVTDAEIYQLMDKSGITRGIQGLPMQMQAMGQQMALTAKDPAEHQAFMQMFLGSMDTDKMLATMAEYLRAHASQKQVQALLSWMESDLVSRFIQAELRASEPQFQQELMTYLAELQAAPPSQERTAAVVNFVSSSEMVEQSLKMVTAMLENMFSAVKALNPGNEELATNLDNQADVIATALRGSIEQQMIISSYYIYQDFSNEELAQYSQFYQQELGKSYLKLLFGGMGEAMSDWGVSLIQQIEQEQAQ
ncbi:MAG: hypothetical protein ACFHVJ_02105 [Aestuariibacter sp.]